MNPNLYDLDFSFSAIFSAVTPSSESAKGPDLLLASLRLGFGGSLLSITSFAPSYTKGVPSSIASLVASFISFLILFNEAKYIPSCSLSV